MRVNLPQTATVRYGVPFLAVGIALFVTLQIDLLAENAPFPLFYAVITLTAWYVGRLPGLLAVAVSALVTWYFIVLPRNSLGMNAVSVTQLIMFVAVSLLINWLAATLKKRTRYLFENNPFPMWFFDRETFEFLAVNNAAVRHYGYTRDEFLAMTIKDIRPPQDVAHLLDEVSKNEQKLKMVGVWQHLKKDGSVISVEVVSHELDFEGRPARLVLSIDITEQEKAREAIRQHESLLLEVFGSCPVAVTVNRLSDRTFIDVNKEFTRLTGYSREEVIGRTSLESALVDEETTMSLRSELNAVGQLDKEIIVRNRYGEPRRVIMGTVVIELFGEKQAVTTFVDITERKKSEEALQASEARYRTLFEYAPDGILIADPDGYYLDANPRICDMLGYSLEELTALHSRDVVAEKEIENIEPVLKAVAGGADSYKEWKLKRKDGSQFDGEVIVTVMPDGNLMGMVRDVTERKEADLRIQRLNRVYAVLSGINETIVREKDPQKMIESACRIAVELGGLRMAWIGMIEGKGNWIQISAQTGLGASGLRILKQMIGDGPESCLCHFTKTALEMGVHSMCGDVENDPLAAPWREPGLERNFLSMASFPLHVKGAVIGTFNLYADKSNYFDEEEIRLLDELAMDIGFALEVHEQDSERKRAENALRESDERFRQLADNINDVFWIRSADMKKLYYISPAYEKIWGRSIEDMYSAPGRWMDFVAPEDREFVLNAFMANTNSNTGLDIEYRVIRPDDEMRWVRVRGFKVRNADGKVIRQIGIVTDITERKQLEEQFRQSQKMEAVGLLAGGIAHDFNNLLTAIIGYSDIALKKIPADDALRPSLEEIRKAGDRAAALTGQLLAFSRKQVLQPKVQNLNTIIRSLQKMLGRIIPENIEVCVNPDPDLGNIRVDPAQIEQVVMNLAVNARDAMIKGGLLTLETHNVYLDEESVRSHSDLLPGEFIQMAVADTGEGMDESTQKRIFEPFFTTKEVGKGTGLGLSTVYGAVRQSGGFITVRSEIGVGTTFNIYLPRVYEGVDTLVKANRSKHSSRSATVLLVEDEDVVRDLIAQILKANGHEVLEAVGGEQALSICEIYSGDIDLLLTDVVMPKMGGEDLGRRITQARPAIKVLYMSGYSDETITNRVFLDPGTAFIEKPFAYDDLIRTVNELLQLD